MTFDDISDIRQLASEWADLREDYAAEIESALEEIERAGPHPRFPRLIRALRQAEAVRPIEQARAEGERPYVELAEQIGLEPIEPDSLEWWGENYEPTLIRDDGDTFERYAEELAEELGAGPRDAAWPASYIDWEAAADALRQDYTNITVDGTDYLIRGT